MGAQRRWWVEVKGVKEYTRKTDTRRSTRGRIGCGGLGWGRRGEEWDSVGRWGGERVRTKSQRGKGRGGGLGVLMAQAKRDGAEVGEGERRLWKVGGGGGDGWG
ncbi:hypothetical protein Tco_1517787 [Tanacetum coccineum]